MNRSNVIFIENTILCNAKKKKKIMYQMFQFLQVKKTINLYQHTLNRIPIKFSIFNKILVK